ncbi:AmmeMemoRadiSam system radical SAM enzyme [candidate division KSB1 bacterium]
MTKKISKRDFVKYSLYGLGGLAAGSTCIKLLSNNLNQLSDKASMDFPAIDGLELTKAAPLKEAYYYSQHARGIRCDLCPNICILKDNEESMCRTHLCKDDKLYTLAYGNPCSMNVDPIEKKPLFHFLPQSRAFSVAIAGCNLACLNCQNWQISQVSPRDTRNYDLMPEKLIASAKKSKCESIAYTYSEPIVFYEYTYESSKLARQAGIKNVMVSAGFINEEPLRKLAKYIDAANIDLKSFDNKIYLKLNGATLEPILKTLKILNEENVWLEITNLIVPGWTDNMDMIKKMCAWLCENGLSENPLHFSRFHPMYKLKQLPATPVSTLEKARNIAKAEGLKYVYIGNVPGTKAENTYCPKCKKLLVERKGYAITQNHILNNSCKYCKEKIAGVWN